MNRRFGATNVLVAAFGTRVVGPSLALTGHGPRRVLEQAPSGESDAARWRSCCIDRATFRPFSWGDTSIAVDYARTEDLVQDGDEFDSVGGLFVQNFDKVATELYLGIRNHSLDRDGADFDDVFAVLVGGRVKF